MEYALLIDFFVQTGIVYSCIQNFLIFSAILMLTVVQVIIAILLTVTILMQNKGSSLGNAFGGGSGVGGGSFHTKRGFEKFLARFSVVLSVLFLGIALLNIYLQG